MIAAQGLGTVLRLARKLGPVIGKVVVVVGQGQNGLIATRLMSQFAAKAVIAIDPVSFSKADASVVCARCISTCALRHEATKGLHVSRTSSLTQLDLPILCYCSWSTAAQLPWLPV